MNCVDNTLSPHSISSQRGGPYSSSVASSASSSTGSVWSDVASQSSDDSSVHSAGTTSDLESYEASCHPSQLTCPAKEDAVVGQHVSVGPQWLKSDASLAAPIEQRQHPRRTSCGNLARSGCPPALIRQCDRKVNFVDSLVDSSAQIVEAIWPLSSSPVCRVETVNKGILPLRTFIQETLRRSRTSYSTLQVALYYLILIKPHVPRQDFTMEQAEDTHSFRALQCGRRMFLSALILASKYLQDRNYSARAWSKISGLHTQEINQNEMTFLLAVNWKLHITDKVFQRWTDIVLRYTPPQPPSPGSLVSRQILAKACEWKTIILGLTPELDNIEDIPTSVASKATVKCLGRMAKPVVESPCTLESTSKESTPTPAYYTHHVLEPSLSTSYPRTKAAPALGLLPTPRLTPQPGGYSTPAASAASYNGSRSSIGLAMAQACEPQTNEKWAVMSSPAYSVPRRSSLATSSTVSSPESMISDNSSRTSRSSSISSASSSMSAPVSTKLDIQARCRYAKQCVTRQALRSITTVPETYSDYGSTSSPESYSVAPSKDLIDLSRDLTLDTPTARRAQGPDYFSGTSTTDAAHALQELHNHPRMDSQPRPSSGCGAKRSRPQSIDNGSALQDNVREMLGRCNTEQVPGVKLSRRHTSMRSISFDAAHVTISKHDGRKRVCCSAETATSSPLPANLAGPGMWNGLLN